MAVTGVQTCALDRKSTRLNSSHTLISYAVFCLKKETRETTHRWIPDTASDEGGPSRFYVIEANSHISPPRRYLSRYGQLLEHAPYCERDLHAPAAPLLVDGTDVEVLVKHRGRGTAGIVGSRMTYATHPFDVVGWDGCL